MPDPQPNLFSSSDDEVRSLLSELLAKSKLYCRSKDYMELLDFVVRLRNFAPFNAMILQIQKPGLRFAASAYEWNDKFQRSVKEGARPLLILWPFAPVALVYDVDDTEGKQLPDDVAQAFRAIGGVTARMIETYARRLATRGIDVKLIPYGDAAAGRVRAIRRSVDEEVKPEYHIRLNSTHDANVQFVSLAHELAHLYLGHIGPDEYLGVELRGALTHQQRELEAESVAYLVCARHGVRSKSESYLADFVSAMATVEDLDLYRLLGAAHGIENLLRIAPHMKFSSQPSVGVRRRER